MVADDPLSAVDANVSRHLFSKCIKGYLAEERKKAVILVSHQLQYMDQVDKVLWLSATGEVLAYGPPNEIAIERSIGISTDEIETQAQPMPSTEVSPTNGSPKKHEVFDQEDRVVGRVTRQTYVEVGRSDCSVFTHE